MTQRGARARFQAHLRSRGVEVVEFDFLAPGFVADYCHARGYLQCFWECGGTLAAPAIAAGVVHKVLAFIAPKIIGGARAPSPVGELGFVEMTQAVPLVAERWQQARARPPPAGSSAARRKARRTPAPVARRSRARRRCPRAHTELPLPKHTLPQHSLPKPSPFLSKPPKKAQVGPDMMVSGFLPNSGGLLALDAAASQALRKPQAGDHHEPSPPSSSHDGGSASASASSGGGGSSSSERPAASGTGRSAAEAAAAATGGAAAAARAGGGGGGSGRLRKRIEFYKPWDPYGALSNFTAHALALPELHPAPGAAAAAAAARSAAAAATAGGGGGTATAAAPSAAAAAVVATGPARSWPSVEHFYQAHKFIGAAHPEARHAVEEIAAAPSPEEAARVGRRLERARPELLRPDWPAAKVPIMREALRAKFGAHAAPRALLLSTAGRRAAAPPAAAPGRALSSADGAELVEASPHDYFWGAGLDGSGANTLGALLGEVRAELAAAAAAAPSAPAPSG